MFIQLSSETGTWTRLEAIVPPMCILTELSYEYKHGVGSQSEFLCLVCFKWTSRKCSTILEGRTDWLSLYSLYWLSNSGAMK